MGAGLSAAEAASIMGGGQLPEGAGFANGTMGTVFSRPTSIMVGEAGSERVSVDRSSNVTNHWSMTVNTRATTPSVVNDFHMMQSITGAAT